MPRRLDTRVDREEGRRTVGAAEQVSAAIRRRHLWRAEAAMGVVIRNALARAGGINPAALPALGGSIASLRLQ